MKLFPFAALASCFQGFDSFHFPVRTAQINRALPILKASSDLVDSKTSFDADTLRKWYLLNHQKRVEVVFVDTQNIEDIVPQIWKSILISFRVLENDEQSKTHSGLYAFKNIKLDTDKQSYVKQIEKRINDFLVDSKLLLQPEYQYSTKLIVNDRNGDNSSQMPLGLSLAIYIEATKTKPELTSIDDIEDVLPAFEDTMTNTIPSFPFPSIYDFISEINRPVDPFTLANLRFNFQVQDLKFDLEKMKKKNKNPQEYVDGINCRLTRLAKWRDVLTSVDTNTPDPFDETYEWGQNVRSKYQSLLVQARRDPKYALDNQYDKRATFIKIIDEWSFRLKQSFKFIYESKRPPPQDFLAPILASKWRNDVIKLTKLPAQVAFLDLEGPYFVPGKPASMFNESRRALWEYSYPVPLVMQEMLLWIDELEHTKKHFTNSNGQDTKTIPMAFTSFGHITQHTYSRGYVTERVIHDCWLGLTSWLRQTLGTSTNEQKEVKKYSATAIISMTNPLDEDSTIDNPSNLLSSSGSSSGRSSDVITDHTEVFKNTLRKLNKFSRQRSEQHSASVKEMYRDKFLTGKELSDWWTNIIRDLDLVDTMDRLATEPNSPGSGVWTETMEKVISKSVKAGDELGDSIDMKAAAQFATVNGDKWYHRYKPVIQDAEIIRGLLPWKDKDEVLDVEDTQEHVLEWLGRQAGFGDDTPIISFDESSYINTKDSKYISHLFVVPRYFRGIGLNEELSAFVEFCKLVATTVSGPKSMLSIYGPHIELEMIPLHPHMIDVAGRPDYARRSPHPAILFRIPVSSLSK